MNRDEEITDEQKPRHMLLLSFHGEKSFIEIRERLKGILSPGMRQLVGELEEDRKSCDKPNLYVCGGRSGGVPDLL